MATEPTPVPRPRPIPAGRQPGRAIDPSVYGHPGESNGNAKLNPARILRIVAQYEAGETMQEIADQHGTTKSNVSRIINGQAWSHVTGIAPTTKES